ncbi:glycosyltransferase [Leptolyngbya sp. GB1-A1]|uniref:glycosyltransferase n=1 Tax=Leptolyngbya sp. GB1-A1 TaxID=2933908 RepID=UPI00329934BB
MSKLKLVVLDANYYWTEQLFSTCHSFADVLLLRPIDFRAFYSKYGHCRSDRHPQLLTEGIWEQRICCPPGWLFQYWFLTRRFLAHLIRQFQGDQSLIFVFNYPYYHTLTRCLNAYSIYYNIDDYREYWKGREQQTPLVEQQAIAHANLTLCVAEYRAQFLKTLCPAQADRIAYLPHGCTPDFMVEQPLHIPRPLPQPLSTYTRPIAGYIGALSDRFDFTYLAQVAEQLPDVTFLLGGQRPKSTDGSADWWQGVERVQRLQNVHFIGFVPHERLGEYLQSFDVLLIPYSLCNFNLNACPTKLWDYMGTSLPIVANSVVPEVRQWEHVIHIAEDPGEFVQKLGRALANPAWKAQERLDIAQAHTWTQQGKKLKQLLVEHECPIP